MSTASSSDDYVTKNIVFGNIARHRGKKATKKKSHDWTLYVRSGNNEDMSGWLKSVSFTLHPSIDPPTRTMTEAPFEIRETGWGEFEVLATLTFTDPDEEGVDLKKTLVLFDLGDDGLPVKPAPPTSHLVVDELHVPVYFEVSKCKEAFLNKLRNVVKVPPTPVEQEIARFQSGVDLEPKSKKETSRKRGRSKSSHKAGSTASSGDESSGRSGKRRESGRAVADVDTSLLTGAERAEYKRLVDAAARVRDEIKLSKKGYFSADQSVEQLRTEIKEAERTLTALYAQLSPAARARLDAEDQDQQPPPASPSEQAAVDDAMAEPAGGEGTDEPMAEPKAEKGTDDASAAIDGAAKAASGTAVPNDAAR
jgi:hypothetical protein